MRHDGRADQLRGDEALVGVESARAALSGGASTSRRPWPSPAYHGCRDRPRRRRGGTGRYGYAAARSTRRPAVLAGRPGDVLASEQRHAPGAQGRGIRYLEGRVERLKGIDHRCGWWRSSASAWRRLFFAGFGDALRAAVGSPGRHRSCHRRSGHLLFVVLGGGKTATRSGPASSCWTSRAATRSGFSPSEIAGPAFRVRRGPHVGDEFHPVVLCRDRSRNRRVLTQFAPPSGSHDTTTYQPYAVEGTRLDGKWP